MLAGGFTPGSAGEVEAERPASADGKLQGVDRLSALDAMFLAIESERHQMHIGLVATFEKGPLRTPDGRLDVDRIRGYSRAVLASLPKFRKKLVAIPILRHPVLVDDEHFDPDYHLRFISLEHESTSELQDLVGRIFSEPLSREHPLWEMWVLDGLPDETFAVVTKTHHCMVDGVTGVAAFAAMLSPSPEVAFEPAASFEVEPAPSSRELLGAELGRILGAVRAALRPTGPDPGKRAQAFAAGIKYLVRAMLPRVSPTLLNPPRVGETRSFAWAELDLAAVKAVKNAASVKVNDVVLATVAGAMRRFLGRHGHDVSQIRFRAFVPVSTHELGNDILENDVSFLLIPLPLAEPDPRRRLELVSGSMVSAKSSGEIQALRLIEKMADVASFGAVTAVARAVPHLHLYNVIVTNVPGPDLPLYFLGSRLRGVYPLVPLYGDNAVGIALVSCSGKLFWGFNADQSCVPDLAELVDDVREAFRELEAAVRA